MSTNLPVDGVMTPATRSVIRSFQQREGLNVTGIMGPDTEDALKRACSGTTSAPSSDGGPDGSSTAPAAPSDGSADGELSFEAEEEGLGEAHEASPEFVRWVQRSLNEASELRLPLDGIASPAMRSAVRSFQARQGLPVTGIVGTDTEEALREVTWGELGEAEAAELVELETLGPLTAELRWLPDNDRASRYALDKAVLEPGGGVYIATNKHGTPLKVGVTNSFKVRLARYAGPASKIGGVWFYLAHIRRGRIEGSGIAGADKAIEYAIARTLMRAGRSLPWHKLPKNVARIEGTVEIRNILPKPLMWLTSKAFTATPRDSRGQPISPYPSPPATGPFRLLKSKHPEWEAWDAGARSRQAG